MEEMTLEPRVKQTFHRAGRVKVYHTIMRLLHDVHLGKHINGQELICVDAQDLEDVLEWAREKAEPKRQA